MQYITFNFHFFYLRIIIFKIYTYHPFLSLLHNYCSNVLAWVYCNRDQFLRKLVSTAINTVVKFTKSSTVYEIAIKNVIFTSSWFLVQFSFCYFISRPYKFNCVSCQNIWNVFKLLKTYVSRCLKILMCFRWKRILNCLSYSVTLLQN